MHLPPWLLFQDGHATGFKPQGVRVRCREEIEFACQPFRAPNASEYRRKWEPFAHDLPKESAKVRFRTGFAVCLALASAGAVCADTIEVPLKFEIAASRSAAGVPIGAVRVADFDMLAPGAKEAPLALDLATSDTQRGIVRNEDDPSSAGVKGGRGCRWNPRSTGAGFYADREFAQQGARKDMYVLVEYFDSLSAGTPILLGYMCDDPEAFSGFKQVEGDKSAGSNTWKKFQVHLTDAKFDRRPSMSSARIASDFWVTYSSSSQDTFYPSGYGYTQLSLKPPDGEWKMPELTGANPAFATFKFGENEMLAAVDRQTSVTAFYDRLRLDLNGNRDLTDDAPIVGILRVDPSMKQCEFRDIDVKTRIDGKELPYRFSFQLYYYAGRIIRIGSDGKQIEESSDDFNIQNLRSNCLTQCYYEGKAQFDGQPFTVALIDSNTNGRFDEMLTAPQNMSYGDDRIYYSGDRLCFAPGDRPKNDYTATLGNRVLVNGRLYNVEVKNAEEKLLLTPSTDATANLKLPAECKDVEITSDDFRTVVMAWKTGGEIRVPAGKYRVVNYSMERAEPNGLVWLLSAGATKNTPYTAATAENSRADNLLKFGEPFSPRVTIPEWAKQNWRSMSRGPVQARQNRSLFGNIVDALTGSDSRPPTGASIQLSFNVYGEGNDQVSGLSLARATATRDTSSSIELSSKSPNQPKEPEYKILKKDGELVASGKFEYG
jgi:hypothetical protein